MQAEKNARTALEPRLEKIRQWVAQNLPEEKIAVMERHIAELRESGIQEQILKVGDVAPSFELENQHGERITSSELLKNGPLVVSFYRGSWCPYCVEEVRVLNEVYPQIKEAGADMVVISPQSAARTQKQAAEIRLGYSMLVDKDNHVGKAFGLVYGMPQYLRDLYWGAFQNNIQEINDSYTWELPVPARFVIGTDGKILDVQSDPDYRYRPEPMDTVAFLNTLS